MSYRTPEEIDRAAFADECARHAEDVLAKQAGAHHEELCKLEEESLRIKEAVLKLFEHFSPEHIDYVTGSNVGTNLKAATHPISQAEGKGV